MCTYTERYLQYNKKVFAGKKAVIMYMYMCLVNLVCVSWVTVSKIKILVNGDLSGGCDRYTFTFILYTYTFKLVKVAITCIRKSHVRSTFDIFTLICLI